jgi:hypothetical protein
VGLNAIQQHVRGVLDGLTVPGQVGTLTAYVQPPTVEELDGARAYIWTPVGKGTRQSMPRGPGFTTRTWNVHIWLMYLDSTNSDTDIEQTFPLLIDAVDAALLAAVMPIFITDPTTEQPSQLLAIGEEYALDYPPARTPGNLQMLLSEALITTTVKEALQA